MAFSDRSGENGTDRPTLSEQETIRQVKRRPDGGSGSYNKNRSSTAKADNSGDKKHGLTDGQKKAIAIGAAAVAAGLAAYGGYKLYQKGKLNPAIAGMSLKGQAFAKIVDKTRSLSDEKWMADDPAFDGLTDEQKTLLREVRADALSINGAKWKGAIGDPSSGVQALSKLPENRQMNCGACSIAGIKSFLFGERTLAREDWNKVDPYRIAMGEKETGLGMSKRLFMSLIPGAKSTEAHCDGLNDLKSYITKAGDKSTGAIFLPIGFGEAPHWVQWINVGGKAFVVDNQAGVVSGIDKYMDDTGRYTVKSNRGRAYRNDDTCLSIYSVSKEAIQGAKDTEFFISGKGGRTRK